VKPEHADNWPEISRDFTEACQAEEGCLWYFWSRTLDDPTEYVLVEAFKDPDAGGAHDDVELGATAHADEFDVRAGGERRGRLEPHRQSGASNIAAKRH